MKDESSNLLDLDSLSVRLTKIAEGLEKAKGADIIQRLVSVVLNLMAHREEYYYQFSQGGCATGFGFFSAELMNGCTKTRTLIREETESGVVAEQKKGLGSNMRKIDKAIHTGSKFRHARKGTCYTLPFFQHRHKVLEN